MTTHNVTLILDAIHRGEPLAAEQLLPLVYDELRRLAAQKMAQEPADHTLQPTALVHEAYLRLVDDGARRGWESRGHFYAAAAEAMRRIIREEEPPRPSLRLSTLAQATTTTPTDQHAQLRSLAADLRGDLDWIVMKALEKDRRRRYDTALEFARDVQRYLEQQPVMARPPSPWYRFSKFARRNKAVLTTAFVVLLALVTGTTVSTWQAIRATRAQAEAEALRKEAVEFADRLKRANVLLDSARANADQQRYRLALTEYTEATELQPDHYLTWSRRGSLYARLGAWRTAAADFAKALKLGAPANNPGWLGVPQLCVYAGEEEAYRLVCTTLRQQVKQHDDPAFVTIAVRSLALQPLPTEEARALARRVEQLREEQAHRSNGRVLFLAPASEFPPGPSLRERSHGRPGPGGGPPRPARFPPELRWYASGLAHFRAGDVTRSLTELRKVVESEGRFPASRMALSVLAMAYHQLGQMAEAQDALAKAGQAVDEWTSDVSEGSLDQLPFPWWLDFIECLVLHREAHQRIERSAPPVDERLGQIEQRALAMLRGE